MDTAQGQNYALSNGSYRLLVSNKQTTDSITNATGGLFQQYRFER
jgi:hypothetical protein